MSLRALIMPAQGAMSRQLMRSLLVQPNVLAVHLPVKQASSFKPAGTFDRPSMFSWTMLKKYWEISPIIIIITATVFCQVLWIMRTAVTRDDVRYGGKETMLCESRELDREAPPVRKFRVYNQKYDVSPELHAALEALKPPTEASK